MRNLVRMWNWCAGLWRYVRGLYGPTWARVVGGVSAVFTLASIGDVPVAVEI